MNWLHGSYMLSDDQNDLDFEAIMRLMRLTYWAAERPREVIARAIEHSLCFGLFHGKEQVGFARAVTDTATFTWICDVIIDPAHRGGGIGKWMVETVLAHPSIAPTRWVLATRDAHTLYKRYGFTEAEKGFFLTRGFTWIPENQED